MNQFVLIGLVITFGLLGAKLFEKIKAPHVVGYIIVGVILGVSVSNILSPEIVKMLGFVNSFALALIGFIIGGELAWTGLKTLGKSIILIAILESFGAFLLVFISLLLITSDMAIALVFGALASATAPAATVDVLWEYKSKGPLTTTLFAVVGIDDAIALLLFAIAAAVAKIILVPGNTISVTGAVTGAFFEIASAIFLGVLFGIILNFAAKFVKTRGELLILGLAAITLASGLATQLNLSLILTNLIFGVTLINISAKNKRIFEAISQIAPPVFLLFFLLVGARLQLNLLLSIGFIGLVYIFMRVLGKSGGAYLGAKLSKAPENVRKYLAFGLLSQAGVAIGLAIEVSRSFAKLGPAGSRIGTLAINVIVATTLIFQIFGPIATKYAIFKAGEARAKPSR